MPWYRIVILSHTGQNAFQTNNNQHPDFDDMTLLDFFPKPKVALSNHLSVYVSVSPLITFEPLGRFS
jgi:hypothetical protein